MLRTITDMKGKPAAEIEEEVDALRGKTMPSLSRLNAARR